MTATISPNELSVTHSIRPDVGREFLSVDIPNGWDDVKKLTKKVLIFEGRKFVFCSWNSDTMKCNFYRMLDGSTKVARIA